MNHNRKRKTDTERKAGSKPQRAAPIKQKWVPKNRAAASSSAIIESIADSRDRNAGDEDAKYDQDIQNLQDRLDALLERGPHARLPAQQIPLAPYVGDIDADKPNGGGLGNNSPSQASHQPVAGKVGTKVQAPPPAPHCFADTHKLVINWELPSSSLGLRSVAIGCLSKLFPVLTSVVSLASEAWKHLGQFAAPSICSFMKKFVVQETVLETDYVSEKHVGLSQWSIKRFAMCCLIRAMVKQGPAGQMQVRSVYSLLRVVRQPTAEQRAFFMRSAKCTDVPTELAYFSRHTKTDCDLVAVDLDVASQLEVKATLTKNDELHSFVQQSASRLLYPNLPSRIYPLVLEDTVKYVEDRVVTSQSIGMKVLTGAALVGVAGLIIGGIIAVDKLDTRLVNYAKGLIRHYLPEEANTPFMSPFSIVLDVAVGAAEEVVFEMAPKLRLPLMWIEFLESVFRFRAPHNVNLHATVSDLPLGERIGAHCLFNLCSPIFDYSPASFTSTFPSLVSLSCSKGVFSFFTTLLSLAFFAAKNLFPSFRVFNAYGYRIGEVEMPPARPSHAEVRYHSNFDETRARRVMQATIGLGVFGIAPPMPDADCAATALQGAQHRFACDMRAPDTAVLMGFSEFVKDYVIANFDPILPGEIPSLQEWLKGTNYPEWRCAELMRTFYDHYESVCDDDYGINSFVKHETYPSFKHARGINSQEDVLKCYVGPAFSAIEKIVYCHPAFIKHVPVRNRPQFIVDRLGHHQGPWFESDYTSFEGSFSLPFLYHCEMHLYRHMLHHYPHIYHHVSRSMLREHHCRFKWFTISVMARRMSGEMCTSLGNGFSNLMLAMFCAKLSGVDIDIIVEGDDGLFCTNGPIDLTPAHKLGFELKLECHSSILSTSFCGLQLSRHLTSMTDPRKVLLNFGWSHSQRCTGGRRVKLGLLRAKALSLLYEHPRCPILSSLAARALLLTSGVRPVYDSNWYDDQLKAEVDSNIDWATAEYRKGIDSTIREDFSALYGISPEDQEALEEEISQWRLGIILSSRVTSMLGQCVDAFTYYDMYVIT